MIDSRVYSGHGTMPYARASQRCCTSAIHSTIANGRMWAVPTKDHSSHLNIAVYMDPSIPPPLFHHNATFDHFPDFSIDSSCHIFNL